ncbi:MAG: hypothetical protein RR512_00030 [Coprobacillus sp.]
MLEEFYQNLYHDFFFKWIVLNTKTYCNDHIICQIHEDDKNCKLITFDMDTVCGSVTIWLNNIVEEKIIQKDNQNILFYLHYNVTDLAQCRLLSQEFYRTLLLHNNEHLYKIAFCGNDGLSTSIFVDDINELIELENLDFHIQSLSLDELCQSYQEFDAIYLAPQIAFKQADFLRCMKDIPIHRIDPTDFATKDYQSILKSIEHNLKVDKKCYH